VRKKKPGPIQGIRKVPSPVGGRKKGSVKARGREEPPHSKTDSPEEERKAPRRAPMEEGGMHELPIDTGEKASYGIGRVYPEAREIA